MRPTRIFACYVYDTTFQVNAVYFHNSNTVTTIIIALHYVSTRLIQSLKSSTNGFRSSGKSSPSTQSAMTPAASAGGVPPAMASIPFAAHESIYNDITGREVSGKAPCLLLRYRPTQHGFTIKQIEWLRQQASLKRKCAEHEYTT